MWTQLKVWLEKIGYKVSFLDFETYKAKTFSSKYFFHEPMFTSLVAMRIKVKKNTKFFIFLVTYEKNQLTKIGFNFDSLTCFYQWFSIPPSYNHQTNSSLQRTIWMRALKVSFPLALLLRPRHTPYILYCCCMLA